MRPLLPEPIAEKAIVGAAKVQLYRASPPPFYFARPEKPSSNSEKPGSISVNIAVAFVQMANQRKSTASPVDETREVFVPRITLSRADCTDTAVLPVSELIAYSGHTGYTRLNLVGRKVLDVRETTAEIDQLVREASQRHVSSGSSASVGLAA